MTTKAKALEKVPYDFAAPQFQPQWHRGQSLGSVVIGSSYLCALMEVKVAFNTATYVLRVDRRSKGSMLNDGSWLTLPSMSIPNLMKLDMDCLMSAIGACGLSADKQALIEEGSRAKVLVHTNEEEDPRWLDLVKRCPYARPIMTIPSKVGAYKITTWLISLEDFREVR